MKLVIALAIAIVAVSGKSLREDIEKLRADINKAGTPKKYENMENSAEESLKVFAGVDAATRAGLMKDSGKIQAITADSSKTLGDRYKELAEILQHTADLWKQAIPKPSEDLDKVKAEMKQALNDSAVTNPEETIHFFAEVDTKLRADIMKESMRTMPIIMDSSKTLGEKFKEMAESAQNLAVLWQQAAQKKNEAPVTAA